MKKMNVDSMKYWLIPGNLKVIDFYYQVYINVVNVTVLCGDRGFVVWSQDKKYLGKCFLDLAFLLPAQVSSFRFVAHASWQLNIFLDIEAPPPTIWVSKPPTTSWEPSYRSTSWSVQWISWSLVTLVMALLLIIQALSLHTLAMPPSPVGGRRRSCPELFRPLPGPYIWCTLARIKWR